MTGPRWRERGNVRERGVRTHEEGLFEGLSDFGVFPIRRVGVVDPGEGLVRLPQVLGEDVHIFVRVHLHLLHVLHEAPLVLDQVQANDDDCNTGRQRLSTVSCHQL